MRPSALRLGRPALLASALSALVALAILALPALAQSDPFALRSEFLTQAAFTCGDVSVEGNSTVTSLVTQNVGHVVSNGGIKLTGSSRIRGNATAGPGKTIVTTGTSQVTGTKGNLTSPWPCAPVDLAALGQVLAVANDNATIPKTSRNRSPLSGTSPPDLILSGNETLSLPAGTYYVRDLKVSGSSAMTVTGEVRFLVTGLVRLDGNAAVNLSGSPGNLRIFTSGAGVTITGSSKLKAFVYAPSSAANVNIEGNTSLTGGLYGGSLKITGSSVLNRDLSMVPVSDPLGLALTESGQPLLEGAVFRRAVTPVVTTTGGTAPVSVTATLDGAAWTSGTTVSAEGAHVLVVTATDSASPPGQLSVTRHFTIDTQAPTISVTAPPAGVVLAASPVLLTGTATGASELTLFGAPVALGPDGSFSATVPLSEGLNPLLFHARDAAGNDATLTHPLVLDTLPPVLTLGAPASGACVAAGASLAVSGRYTDAHPRPAGAPEGPAVSVTLTLPAGAATTLPAAVDPLGAFALSFPLPEGAEGSATLLVTAADALGHTARTLATVRVDATVPEVALTLDGAPFPGVAPGEAPPAGTTPTLFSRAVSPRVTVRDGAAAPPPATLTLDGQPYVDGTSITAEGTHLLVARATDCAGHEAVVHALFALDITPPALLSTTPADGALLKDPVTTFSGTASPDVVAVRLAGRDAFVEPAAPGAESVAFHLTPFPWREGENSVSVDLVDRAGNRTTFTRTFTVKTTGPLVEILLGGVPLGTGKTFFAAVTPEVRTNEPLTGPDAATLTATLDGAPWTPGTAIAAAGSHTLTATVVDATGREAIATASFAIDTTPGPAVSITSPADGATLPGPTVDLSGTVSAPHSSGPTVVRVNGRAAIVDASGTTWSLTALPLEPDAPNDLVAVAVDALGRTATAAVQVLVRSGAPQVVLLSPADGARTNRRRIDLVGAVLGGAAATADGLVRAHGLTAAIDATGAFRLLDLPLAEGPNPLAVTATDPHGRTGEATVTVFSDTVPPAVSFTASGQPLLDGAVFTGPVTVSIAVSDAGGLVSPPRILLGGAPVEATGAVTDVVISEAGGQVLSVVAVDAAGNETRASRSFVAGGGGCAVTDVRPVEGSTTPDAKVTLTGRCGSARRLLVRVPQPGGGAPQEYVAAIADGTFAAGDVPLPALGDNLLELVCETAAGSPSTTLHRITRLPAGGPEVSITSPASGALVASPNVTLSGTVSDETADLFVNGVRVDAAFRAGASFTQPTVTLTEGPNVLVAKAVDRAGRTGEARVVLQRDTQTPRVTVVWPTSGARFGRRGEAAPVADVTGAVDLSSEPNLSSVVVSSPNGSVTATVDPVTGAFRADGLPLGAASGPARVTVLATDAAGHVTTVEVDVVVDADVDAPALALAAPGDLGRLTASSPASLPVTGEAWAEEGATVSVNGISLDPATLAWEPATADGRRRVSFATSLPAPAQDGPFGVIVRVEDLDGRSASTRRLLVRDTVAPKVVEIVPAAGATEVDPNGMVLVLFSEEVSGPSLTAPGGFRVTRDGQSEPIVGTFTRAGSAVAFVPGAALTPGASYRVVLGAGLTDLAGNPVEPFESTFAVAPALSGTAPAFDPAPPAVLCANALELGGTAPPGASLRATVGDVSLTATADASGRFLVSLPLLGNGYHAVSVRLVGRDGSLGPAVHALVRKDCSAPLVERAELDREAGRVTVLFSERMSPASLALSTTPGDGASLLLTLESDPAGAPRPGTLSLDSDGETLRIDLPQASDAWWRDEPVRLTVRPPAADERGNLLTAPWVTTFFPGAGPGDLSGGFLSGEAYDDATGRPLDGVETRLYASTAALPGAVETPDAPSAVSTTDVRGRYGFFGDVAAGRYALHLSKSGYTPALRRLPLAPGTGAVPFDARLTPLAEPSAERLDPAVGGSFEGGAGPAGSGGAGSDGGGAPGGTAGSGSSDAPVLLLDVAPAPFAPGVSVPSGTLAVRLTPLSAQALPELLPLGWSPLSAADVRLETEGASPASPAPLAQSARFAPGAVHLTLALPAHTPPTAALVAVRHDVASGRWLTLGEVDRRAGSGSTDVARVALVSPGAVAVVLADTDEAIAPPPLPAGEGQPLTASVLPSPPPALTATLALDPPVVGPTGRATARVVARSADGVTRWPSGLAVQAWLDEKLVLSGGGELYEAPYTADLVLSHHPVSPEEEAGATPGTFGALAFTVSPSPKASQVLLESGHENVRLYPFPDSLERGSVLGGFGGTVSSADGVEMTLPEGALAESVAVEARLLTEAEHAALAPPAGYDLLAAVRVGFSGRTLARAATLSVPLPEGAPEDPALEARLLLAWLVAQPADGRGAFARLTARAARTTPTGSSRPHALCVPEPPGSPLPLEGLLAEGTYLVLRARAPLGFATGFVRIGSGNGLADSRVGVAASSSPFLATADLTRPGGRYAIPVPAGADRDVVALHPRLDEAATARIASLAPSAVVALDLLVRPVGPRVVSVQPSDGATSQPITSPLLVRFTEPIDPASVVPGLLTAELLAEDGSATGAFFHGALALQADGASLVFTPTHPFPPGRRIRGRLASGVRDAGGTPYEGPVPYLWSFTTSTQVQTGGQIDLTKIRLLLPENGTARIVGSAGAIPTVLAGQTPWSVSPSVENAALSPICPTNSTPVDSTGAFSVLAGCASTPVSLSSRVYLKVIDPAGNVTVLPLGPYVTADGLGFVPTPGRTTVYTTPEGVEVTVPAGAFETARVVRVVSINPAGMDLPVSPDFEPLLALRFDFDGEASETLRFRMPVTTSAPVGTLVFGGAPMNVPWGRKLRIIELARIVAGSGGQKLLSNHEQDQPGDSSPGLVSFRTGPGPLGVPRDLIRRALLEMKVRGDAVFMRGTGAEMAAISGRAPLEVFGQNSFILLNKYADQWIYTPLPHDWSGDFILPAKVGASLSITVRNSATGWIVYEQDLGSLSGEPGQLLPVAELAIPDRTPLSLLDGSPTRVYRFVPPIAAGPRSCRALALEIQVCVTESGRLTVEPVGETFPLPEGSEVVLVNRTTSVSATPARVGARGSFTAPGLTARPSDELTVVVNPAGLDPSRTRTLDLVFTRGLSGLSAATLESLARLHDCGLADGTGVCGSEIPVVSELSGDGRALRVGPVGSLAYGRRYRLTLDRRSLVVRTASGEVTYSPAEPETFFFATRKAAEEPLGSLSGGSLGDTDAARDLAKLGNLLLVASGTGRIVAVDVSDPVRPRRFALMNGTQSDARAFAADSHNRLFFNGLYGSAWGIGAIALEDVRAASTGSCDASRPSWAEQEALPCFDRKPGGIRVAFATGYASGLLASEYLSLTGGTPSGTPATMNVLVEDDEDEPRELEAFWNAHRPGAPLPSPDPFGTFTLSIPLDTEGHRAIRTEACPTESTWDRFQRVSIDNLTTGQTWSFDVENPWPSGSGDGKLLAEGIRARRGDRLRVRYNLRAWAYVAIVGSGVSVLDLNRAYRSPLVADAGPTNAIAQCGRRLGGTEGQDVSFPACGGGAGAQPSGFSLTTDAVPLADDRFVDVYSVLRHFGPIHTAGHRNAPGNLQAVEVDCLKDVAGADGPVFLRALAVARDVDYDDRGWRGDAAGRFTTEPGFERKTVSGRELAFVSLGAGGILVLDVTQRVPSTIVGRIAPRGRSYFRLQVDERGRRLYAGGWDERGASVIDAFSLASVNGGPEENGRNVVSDDARLLLSLSAPWDANHIALDEAGTGLLFTWGAQGVATAGGRAIPVEGPRITFAGLYRPAEAASSGDRPDVFPVETFRPLGIPVRVDPREEVDPSKRADAERVTTAAFRVRLALPGTLDAEALPEITARVQTLRALPDDHLLARENLGRAIAMPGGEGWPERDVFLTLRRIGGEPIAGGENGRLGIAYNLYESKEVVLLLADPRAAKGYRGSTPAPTGELASESLQCRRCDRPSYLSELPDEEVKELLAGGPWVRAFLSVDPASSPALQEATAKALAYFGRDEVREIYPAPRGVAAVEGWADSIPSPIQVSGAEPPLNAGTFTPGEAGVTTSLAAGDLLLSANDHVTAGRGLAFAIQRSYRSGAVGYGPLGAAGWSSSLFAHLRFFTPVPDLGYPGEVEYHDGAGSVFRFQVPSGPSRSCPAGWTKDENGSFCVPEGLFVRLVKLSDGAGYKIYDRQHGALAFDGRGLLLGAADRHVQDDPSGEKGSSHRYVYDGFGYLVSAQDDLGRPWELKYKDDPLVDGPEYGLLAEIRDFSGRTVRFGWDEGKQRLLSSAGFPGVTNPFYPDTSVSDPRVEYTYAAPALGGGAPLRGDFAALRLETVKLPGRTEPRARFGYDAAGRVGSISFPSTIPSQSVTWTLSYEGPADAPVTGATATSPWGQAVEYGLLAGRNVARAETLPVFDRIAKAPVTRRVTTQFAYEADGRASAVTWPDGSVTRYCYADSSAQGCIPQGSGDRLELPNVLGVVRSRGSAPKGPAGHGDDLPSRVEYGGDNVPTASTDALGRRSIRAVSSPSGQSESGFDDPADPLSRVTGRSSYDAHGRLVAFVGGDADAPDGPGGVPRSSSIATSYVYETNPSSPNYGRLVRQDRGGIGASYGYDRSGNLAEAITTHGAVTRLSHDEWDREIQRTEGEVVDGVDVQPLYPEVRGVVVQRAYDASGNLVRERRRQSPHGWVETRYQYTSREQLKEVWQTHLSDGTPGGVSPEPALLVEHTYDPVTGLLAFSRSGAGTTTTYGYDAAGRLSSTQSGPTGVQATSGVRSQAFDELGRVVYATDGDEGAWEGWHDAWGRLYAERLATGATLEREHDAADHVVRETVFDGPLLDGEPRPERLSEIRVRVNAFGAPTEVRELVRAGSGGEPDEVRLTRTTYDAAGRAVAVESGPEGGALRLDATFEFHDGSGLLFRQTDARGNQTVLEYPGGTEWAERIVSLETVPGSADKVEAGFTRSWYDALGRTLSTKRKSGDESSATFDETGNLISTTARGVTTTRRYDARGQVLEIVRPAGRGRTLYGYDRDGKPLVKSTTTATGDQLTRWTWDDPTGRLFSILHPDETTESFTYYLDDTLRTHTRRDGVLLTHAYGPANDLRSVVPTLPPGANLVVDGGDRYSRDRAGRLLAVERLSTTGGPDPRATVRLEGYDTGGRPARELVGTREPLVRTFDAWDRPVATRLPAGVGRHDGGAFEGYARAFDPLDRVETLCGALPLLGQQPCAGDTTPLGATWAWGGTDRLYGVTTRGPLKTAHRYGYVQGPGAQPPSGAPPSPFRLGTITLGTTATDPVTAATSTLDTPWGRFGFGHDPATGDKLGRKVVTDAPSGIGPHPDPLSVTSSQGYGWALSSLRLLEAWAGAGRLDAERPTRLGHDSFSYSYGPADELLSLTRQSTAETKNLSHGPEGRILFDDGVAVTHDPEGRRTRDARASYVWTWRGELAKATLESGPWSGHQVAYDYDALGRLLLRTHRGPLPPGQTDDEARPFIETREYLWDGDTLLGEVARAQDGALRWRKSYVPGAGGLDDAVQLRLETYGLDGQTVVSERLFAYLRDELGTVTGLVEEIEGADPARPPLVARYLYSPYGQAHLETGVELHGALLDPRLGTITSLDGATKTQAPSATAAPGGLRLLFSTPIDSATAAAGVLLERRLTDGTWGALSAQDLALGRDSEAPEELLLLPLAGLERGETYRIRFAAELRDTSGRPAIPPPGNLEIAVPASGEIAWERFFPLDYDSALASGSHLDERIPGGNPHLFAGAWTDPATGLSYLRARWYDARTASFLQQDPEEDVDSPNLYAYVGLQPHAAIDPMGEAFLDDAKHVLNRAAPTIVKGALVGLAIGVSGPFAPVLIAGMTTYAAQAALSMAVEASLSPDPGATMLGLTADVTGARSVYEAATGKELGSGRALSREERLDAIGDVIGDVGAAVAGGAAVRVGQGARGMVASARNRGGTRQATATGRRAGAESHEGHARGGTRDHGAEATSKPSRSAREAMDDAAHAARKADDGIGCVFASFSPDTLVATSTGLIPIDQVAPGTEVWAADEETGERSLRKVSSTAFHLAEDGLLLTVGGETLETTARHPFYTAGGEWVEAAKLQVGQEVRSLGGELLRVERIEKRDGRFAVFNFEVDEDHSYFVGLDGLLVHNAGPCGGKPAAHTLSDRDFLQRIAAKAEATGVRQGYGAAGTGAGQGTWKHDYAKRVLDRYQTRTGQKLDLIQDPTSYLNGQVVPYGTAGSSRPDVFNPLSGELFDYKFVKNPGKGLRRSQRLRNAANVPGVFRQTEINP